MFSSVSQKSSFLKFMDLISGSEYGEPPTGLVAKVSAWAFTAILLVAFTVVGFLGVMAGLGGQP